MSARSRHVWRWFGVAAAVCVLVAAVWMVRPESAASPQAQLANVGSPQVLAARVAPPRPRPSASPEFALPAPAADAVALTFDDGPHPEFTPRVLDILDRYGVKATFFLLGQMVEEYPELVREIQERGHAIAGHSMRHDDLTKMDAARVEAELTGVNELIEAQTGSVPTCHRPPYGAHNASTDAVAAQLGLATIMWQVDTNDWRKPGASSIAASAGAAQGGQIVLMHDAGGDRSQTVAALPTIIETLQRRGLRIVPICAVIRADSSSGPIRF